MNTGNENKEILNIINYTYNCIVLRRTAVNTSNWFLGHKQNSLIILLIRYSFNLDLNEEREGHLKSSALEFHIIGPWNRILNFPYFDLNFDNKAACVVL